MRRQPSRAAITAAPARTLEADSPQMIVHGQDRPVKLAWVDGQVFAIDIRLSRWAQRFDLRLLVVQNESQYWLSPLEPIPPELQLEVASEQTETHTIFRLCMGVNSGIRAIVPAIIITMRQEYDQIWHRPIITLVRGNNRLQEAFRHDQGLVGFAEDARHKHNTNAKIMVPWALRFSQNRGLVLYPLELYGGHKDTLNEAGNFTVKAPYFNAKEEIMMDPSFMNLAFDLGWARSPLD